MALAVVYRELLDYGLAQARGQLRILTNTRPIAEVLQDATFPDSLKKQLRQKLLAKYIKDADYQEIDSLYGHDGFLIEYKQLKQILKAWYVRWGYFLKTYA